MARNIDLTPKLLTNTSMTLRRRGGDCISIGVDSTGTVYIGDPEDCPVWLKPDEELDLLIDALQKLRDKLRA